MMEKTERAAQTRHTRPVWLWIATGVAVFAVAVGLTFLSQTQHRVIGTELSVVDIPAINGVRVFYFTPVDSVKRLLQIAERYKGIYADKDSIEILFFNDEASGARDLPMTDIALSCFVAKFELTRPLGRQYLQRAKDKWRELNQGI